MLFVIASWAKAIYVDYLWFESVDYEGNFRRVLSARISLLLAGTLIAGLVLGVNLWLARRLAPQGVEESFIEDVDAPAIRRIVTVALGALTIFIAILFGGVAAGVVGNDPDLVERGRVRRHRAGVRAPMSRSICSIFRPIT